MIDQLNTHLSLEITAHQLYHGFSGQLKFWGYSKLADYFKDAAEEEQTHVDAIFLRIQQLGGQPDYMPTPVMPALKKRDIPGLLQVRLATEKKVLGSLTSLVQKADEDEQDWETDNVCRKLITDTEGDIQWTQAQIDLIAEMGLQNWLQANL
ncbi:MAG: ferritin-like domain-containing protein [Fluviibacter sp.]